MWWRVFQPSQSSQRIFAEQVVWIRTQAAPGFSGPIATPASRENCRRIILQNFYGTLIVDTIGIGLAAAGFLNPLFATLIQVVSELTFILNSTRLLPPRDKTKSTRAEPVAATA